MTDIRFRKMTKKDLQTVARIEAESQSHPWSLIQFLDCFKAGNTGWIAVRTCNGIEVAVAFAIVATVHDESSLLNLCVQPAFRNQGCGKAMLRFLLDQAKIGKINRWFLDVRASNTVAIHLYESMGFEKIATRKDYYPALVGREDGLIYSLSFPETASAAPASASSAS